MSLEVLPLLCVLGAYEALAAHSVCESLAALPCPPPLPCPAGARALYLGRTYYGCLATVLPPASAGMTKKVGLRARLLLLMSLS